jgi:exonuclease III
MMANINKTGGVSASSLIIKSFNVNGLGNFSKRQEIFHFLHKKGGDIYFLIDTRFSDHVENKIKEEWGSNVIFSSFSSQSRGVAIFFKKNLCVEILNQSTDPSGNMLSVLVNFDDNKILFTALYGPNEDNPEFYKEKLFSLIDQWQPDFAVYGGDWNLVMDQNLDTKNYLHENNKNAKNEVKNKMEYYSLIDVWRELNPTSETYSWIGKSTNPKKFARLDFFLISNALFPFIKMQK